MKRKTILAVLSGAALAAALGATAGPADAAATSASFDGTTATLNLDDTDNNVTVSVSGGLLVHGQTTGGLSDGTDWDSATPGPQTVPANGTVAVAVNGGSGNDAITVLAKNTEVAGVQLNGGAGDDVLTGADSNDTLNGGDGNDRLIGAKGNDTQNGDAGNDTLVWNNGDATDVNDGGAGNDATEVNGNATLGDTFTIAPDRFGPHPVPAHEPGRLHDHQHHRALPGQRPGRQRLAHRIRRRGCAHAALRRRRCGRRHHQRLRRAGPDPRR